MPNLVARKLDLEQALASTGSMGEIAVKHREQLDWLKESGAADDGAAEAGGGGPAGSVQWSGRSSQATTKKGWGAIGGGGSLSLKAKTEMLAAKKDSKRIRALEELVGDGTTLEEEAASGELSPFDLRRRQCLVLTTIARGQACNAVVHTADVVQTGSQEANASISQVHKRARCSASSSGQAPATSCSATTASTSTTRKGRNACHKPGESCAQASEGMNCEAWLRASPVCPPKPRGNVRTA
eukprot:COSAG04_NODE_399_length_14959_cov_28.238730_13_plen_241_part_00